MIARRRRIGANGDDMDGISASDGWGRPARAAGGGRWGRFASGARWAACLLFALGIHAAAAAMLLARWDDGDAEFMSAPAILVELSPEPRAPSAPVADLPPGPPQPQSSEQAAPEPEQPAAPVEVAAAPGAEALPSPPPLPKSPDTPPEARQQPKPKPSQASLASAPSPSLRPARRAAAPAPGAPGRDAAAMPNWQSALLARLERYKRYPDEARSRGERGVAQLAFSIDRSGAVHRARIARSSGSAALDRAALQLVERAQPLPPPPPEVRGTRIAVVVPIRYHFR